MPPASLLHAARSLLAPLGAAVLVASALGACAPPKRPDGGQGLLPVGAAAPDVEGVDAKGVHTTLVSRKGHPSVVYFYPKDDTPGCTKEACAFRDGFAKFTAADVTIFGVSQDSAESHKAFLEKHKLPFPLVADEHGEVTKSYGVSTRLNMSERVTFLVGADGKIAHVWPKVDPAIHADEVLAEAAKAH